MNVLEPFTHLRLGFRFRPRSELAFVEWGEIIRPTRNVTRDLDRYAWSTYVLEVIDCMVEGREAEPPLFDLAEELLREIDESYPRPLAPDLLRYFEARLLELTGFEPRLDTCSRCARPAGAAETLRFNPRTSTLQCDRCSDGSGMTVSPAAVEAILRLRRRHLDPGLANALATEVRVVLQTAIAHHVRRPLRSPALLREILGL